MRFTRLMLTYALPAGPASLNPAWGDMASALATEDVPNMEASDLVSIAQKRWSVLVIGAILVAVLAFAVSSALPKTHESRATLVVEASSAAGDRYSSVLAAERTAQTYAELIVRRENLERVIDALGLELTPEQLEDKISVDVAKDSRFIHVRARDRDPAKTQAMANELADVFLADLADTASSSPDLDDLSAQLAQLRLEITETQAAIDSLAARPSDDTRDEELVRLRGDLREDQVTYASLLASYVQLQSLEGGDLAVSLVQAADDSPKVISPRILLNTAVAALGGLVLALGAAIAWERAFPRVTLGRDVHRALGVPFLGTVPSLRGSAPAAELEPVSVIAPSSLAAKRYAHVVQQLQRRSLGNPSRSLLVATPSSPRHGEAVALNLGALLADSQTKVVVVDAHLGAPRLERLLRLNGRAGLIDLMLDEEGRGQADVLQPTSAEGLYVATPGRPQDRPALPGRFFADGLLRILPYLKSRANVVIIDAPPVNEEAWVPELAAELNGAVLVVEANETPADVARQAKDALVRAGARLVGAVIIIDDRDVGSRTATPGEIDALG